MTVLVTGASGMIGSAIVECLLAEGYKVRAQLRSADAPGSLALIQKANEICSQTVAQDFQSMDEAGAEALSKDCQAVIHAAALVHKANAASSQYEVLNHRATKILAEAARKNRVEQFVFFSSSSVYGNKATEMISEEGELCPDTAYAASKIACEKELGAVLPAPSCVILRPSLVFGRGDRGNMLSLIKQVRSGKYFLVGEGNAQKSLICATDLARALLPVLQKPLAGLNIFNLANSKPVTVQYLSAQILAASGKASKMLSLPDWLVASAAVSANFVLGKRSPLSPDRLAKLTRHNSISVTKFCQTYDFEPGQTELRAALSAEIEWALKSGLVR